MTASSERKLTCEQLHELVWNLVARYTDEEPKEILPDSQLVRDLGADSLGVMEISMEVEEELGVTLPDELLGNANLTVREIEEAIWELLSQRS